MSRAVFGFFPSSQSAQRAVDHFRRAGHPETDVQMDQVHAYPGDGTQRLLNPSQGRFGSLAELSLGADVDPTTNAGPLLAASPSASGFGSPDELPGGNGFMVTVLVDSDEEADEVARQIEDLGGLV
ncbi:MAG: hypothetical protein QME79_04210 [Bacillota bacterium]|nr:hypothetical protein [Bacillota bacterium]